MIYPPVISYILKITILKGKTHELSTGPSSIAMFNYKRVCQSQKVYRSSRKVSGIRNFQEADQKMFQPRREHDQVWTFFLHNLKALLGMMYVWVHHVI